MFNVLEASEEFILVGQYEQDSNILTTIKLEPTESGLIKSYTVEINYTSPIPTDFSSFIDVTESSVTSLNSLDEVILRTVLSNFPLSVIRNYLT